MDGRGVTSADTGGGAASRLVWRLFSPSFRLISCTLERNGKGFHLAVRCGDEVMTSCDGEDLAPLHARASDWRAQLESRGYMPASSVRTSAERPTARSSEGRTVFLGLIECAAVLELQQPAIGRQLRDRATEGLVAVGLSDADFLGQTIESCRAIVGRAAGGPGVDSHLINSCRVLLDRIDANPGAASPGGYTGGS